MPDKSNLEQRLQALEKQVAQLQRPGLRGVRYRSAASYRNIPLLAIATGPDLERGEFRGHARGIIAIGDMATGVVAIGGLARGVIALGGLALGAVSLGGLSIGALVAAGGLAIGSLAFGGGAIGGVAVGGGAAGYYACGGGAIGKHTIRPGHQDPAALALFQRYGAEGLCRGKAPHPAQYPAPGQS